MKLKRLCSLFLVGVLAFSITGCKRELPKEDIVDISKDVFEDMDKLVPEQDAQILIMTSCVDFAEEMAKQFIEKYAEYNVKVTIEEKGLGLIDKLSVDGPAGTGADVIITAHDEFIEAMNAQLFYKISDKLVDDIKKDVNQVGIDSVTYENEIYGVPVALETSCLFYNKDIVGEAPATTFEEIYDKSLEYNDYANNKYYFLTKISDGYKLNPFLSAYGFEAFGEEGTDELPGFDSDEFEKGLEVVASLKNIMNMSSGDLSDNYLNTMFKEGKTAYTITGPWDIDGFDKAGLNYGVTTLPTYKGEPMTPFAGVQNAHVSAYTKYPRAAQLFVASFTSEEAAAILYEKESKITTRKDISNVKGISEDEKIACFVEQFTNSVPMPASANVTYYWTVSENVSKLVFDGDLTPAEGRTKALENWSTITGTNK